MSAITLQVGAEYATGTVVSVYNTVNSVPLSPVGNVVTTGTVADDGHVTFSGLTAGINYLAYAASGRPQYVRFYVPESSSSASGSGVPDGGTIDQFLGKLSNTDGDAGWSDLPISVVESINTVNVAGATQTLPDVAVATVHALTLTAANCTLTFPTAVAGKSFTVMLKQDPTGGRLVTWPVTVAWPGGVTPGLATPANSVDVFSFLTVDGTTWLGFTRSQGAAARPYRAAVLADSPISYWRLGEASGSAAVDEQAVNSGTYVGDYTLARVGLLNSEANTAVALGSSAQGHAIVKTGQILSGRTNWTIEAWVKPTAPLAGQILYSERGSAGQDILDFGFSGGSQLNLTYRDHAGTLDSVTASTSLTAGTVAHVAITKAGTAIKFYLNGAQDATGTLTAGNTFGEATAVTWLGVDSQDLTHYFKGVMDEVAVYGTALSSARIAAHYGAGIALP